MLDTFGLIEPTEEKEKRLAEQEAEFQRLTALAEEREALEVHLEREKMNVKNFETYFTQMEQHFETRRAEIEVNEEAIRVTNGQKEEIQEQWLSQQALLREQRGRQEDRQRVQQKEQRLQQSLPAVHSDHTNHRPSEDNSSSWASPGTRPTRTVCTLGAGGL